MLCRWRADPEPGSPDHNMAVDTALLLSLAEGRECLPTIRVYQWDRDSVSIGRLQSEEAVRLHYPSLPLVRRPTGGRAVLHGNDLTISLVLLREHLPDISGNTILSSYHCLVGPLAAALARLGYCLGHGSGKSRGQGNSSVDCFATSAGCDLIETATGRKLVGSAQRRLGQAVLQQMSLPLSLLPETERFLSHLQEEYASALQIHAWQQEETLGK